MAEAARSTGIVKWFSAQKGYGFIAPDHDGEDLFVHQTSIRSDGFRTLSESQPVEFSIESAKDGRSKAVDVDAVPRARRPSPGGGRGGGRGYVGGRGRGSGGYSGGRGGGYGRGGGMSGGYNGGGACYNCGRYGHIARDCYRSRGGDKRYGGGGGGGGGGGCYNCGEEGHFARDCSNTDKN